MRRMSSRSLGAPRPVVSALQWTEVPPSMRYILCPCCLGGPDPGAQLGAEQVRVAARDVPRHGGSLTTLNEQGDKLGMTGQGVSPQASA